VALDRAELEGATFERGFQGGRSRLEAGGAGVVTSARVERTIFDGLIPLHPSQLGREVPMPVDETLLSLPLLQGAQTALNQLGFEAAQVARLLELLWPRSNHGHRAHDYTRLLQPGNLEPATISRMSARTAVGVLGAHASGADLVRRLVMLLGESRPGSESPEAPERPRIGGEPPDAEVAGVNDAVLHAMGGSWREPPAFDRDLATDPTIDSLHRRAGRAIVEQAGRLAPSVFEDPRTCFTLPFWQHLLPITHAVVCVRSPLEAARLLGASHGLSVEESGALWLAYMRALLWHTRGCRRIFVHSEDLAIAWPLQVLRLAAFVGLGVSTDAPAVRLAAEALLAKSRAAVRSTAGDIAEEGRLPLACRSLHLALRALGSTELEAGGAWGLEQDALAALAELASSAEDELRRLRRTLADEAKGRLRATADLARVEQERTALESELRDRAEVELDLVLERQRSREELARAHSDLAAITRSRSYSVLLAIWALHHALAPPGSRRWEWIERALRDRAR
jgi:hypothetical protein